MKKIINHRWMTVAVLSATIVIVAILLEGHGRNEMWLRGANSIPTSSQVAENSTWNPVSTKEQTPSHPQEKPTNLSLGVETVGGWDVVVLGRIDVCGVCQRGSPNLNYTKVLAGKVPNGHTEGTLAVAGVAAHLLPEGGVPIYESQQEEIVLLKRVEGKALYTVVDVMKATPENLALFRSQ